MALVRNPTPAPPPSIGQAPASASFRPVVVPAGTSDAPVVNSTAPDLAAPAGTITQEQRTVEAERLKALLPPYLIQEAGEKNNPAALVEIHRRNALIVAHLRTPEVKEVIANTLRASALVKDEKIDARADQFVADAVAQVQDQTPHQPDRYWQLSCVTAAAVAAAVVKLAVTNITPAHTAGQGLLMTRFNKATKGFDVAPLPGIAGLTDVLKRAFPPQLTGFYVTTGAVREQDFIKVRGGTNPGIEHEINLTPIAEKPNGFIGAYAIIGTNGTLPVTVFYTTAQIEAVNGKKLGENTFYKKTPEKELTNVTLREAQRRFIKERTVADDMLSTVDAMLRQPDEESVLTEGAPVAALPPRSVSPALPYGDATQREGRVHRVPAPAPAIVIAPARPGGDKVEPVTPPPETVVVPAARNAFEEATGNLGAGLDGDEPASTL